MKPVLYNELEDGSFEEIELPTVWEICWDCRGEGKSSAYLGAFTQEDIERDWEPDEWEDYMAGAYDRVCEHCGGSGKVKEVDYEALSPEMQKRWDQHCKEEAEFEAISRAERAMGA